MAMRLEDSSSSIRRQPEIQLPVHTTPKFIQEIQRARDKLHLNVFFAEAFGCFSFTFFLLLSVAGMEITGTFGNWTSTMLTLSIAVMLAVYVSAPISGGQLSPSSVVTNVLLRQFPIKKVPLYLVAHFVGALFAIVVEYGLISSYLDAVDGGVRGYDTLNIFINTPDTTSPNLKIGDLFLHEFLGCIFFNFAIAALLDQNNPFFAPKAVPVMVGATLFALASSFGWCIYVLNPFRDFVPRVYLNAYYPNTFKKDNYWAIALFVPFIGNFFGVLLYDLLLAKNYTDKSSNGLPVSVGGKSANVDVSVDIKGEEKIDAEL